MNNSEKKTNLKFYVGGMTCSACSARVDKVVTAVEGADDVSVNLLKHSMTLNIDESKTSVKEIVDTVKKVVKRDDFKGQVATSVDRECSRITLL